MGALRDAAKNNSNFLLLEKGHAVVVEYRGFQLIPNMRDPSKQSAVIEVLELGRTKYWTTSNRDIMIFFDDCPQGRLVQITRDKFLNKAGIEDPLKSSYSVELYYEPQPVHIPPPLPTPPQHQAAAPVFNTPPASTAAANVERSLQEMNDFQPKPGADAGAQKKDLAWES